LINRAIFRSGSTAQKIAQWHSQLLGKQKLSNQEQYSMFEVIDDRGNLPVFIHSDLDDLGLTPEAFRVYCHLVRRAGKGHAFPKQESIAEACFSRVQRRGSDCQRYDKQLSPETSRRMAGLAIEALEEHGLIQQIKRRRDDGKQTSSQYVLLSPSNWKTWDELHGLDASGPGDHGQRSPGDHGQRSPGDQPKGIPLNEGTPKNEGIYIGEPDFFEFDQTEKSDQPEPIEGELIDPSEESEQNRSVNSESQIVEIKSSAAPAKFSGAIGAFLMAYNEDKPSLWTNVLKNTPAREKAIKTLVKEYGDESLALQALRDALAFCRQDSWWGSKDLGLDNLLRNGRVTQLAEKWQTIANNPQQRATLDALADPQKAYAWAKSNAEIDAIAAKLKAKEEAKNAK